MTIGADPTINPELILQGLATTDPALLTNELNQTRQVNNQSALLPSEIAKQNAEAANLQAQAAYNQMLVGSWSGLSQARKTTKGNLESQAAGTPAPTQPPAPVAPAPPPVATIPQNTQPDQYIQPVADNSQPNSINNNDNQYNTGLES